MSRKRQFPGGTIVLTKEEYVYLKQYYRIGYDIWLQHQKFPITYILRDTMQKLLKKLTETHTIMDMKKTWKTYFLYEASTLLAVGLVEETCTQIRSDQ